MKWLVELIYPKRCFGCGSRGGYFCQKCRGKSLRVDQVCPQCGRASIGGWRHGRCSQTMERLLLGMKYKGMVSLGLRRVKFGSSWAVLDDLFEWWWEEIGKELSDLQGDDWVVSWIPMHETKKKKRGFDQAEVLATKLGEKLGMKVVALLERRKKTIPQFGLGEEERRRNLRGAFKIRSGVKKAILKKKVLLVDDIWTTGSTMREGAKVLRRNGVEEVWGVVVAG